MKIICVGRNYANHAKELGNQVPDEAVLFIKPETSLIEDHTFRLPAFSHDVHYELELAIKICKRGKDISLVNAKDYYDEIGLGIDFTARDLQTELKQKGLPWEKAKAFDGSAFLSPFKPLESLKNRNEIVFGLSQNQELKQKGNSQDMLFNFDQIIVQASQYFTLDKGDIILTGTPEGVGKITSGDLLSGTLEGETLFELKVR